VLAVRDYVGKNGFKGVHLGLSGGIDSALTLAIAADAMGADKVHAVMMPSDYTASHQRRGFARHGEAARRALFRNRHQADLRCLRGTAGGRVRRPGRRHHGRKPAGARARHAPDGAVEQVRHAGADHRQQERNGGRLRHPLRRHGGRLRRAEGRGETRVYRLANYRNSLSAVIPQRIIDRPPSAELRPDQTDQDSLPPYDVLDAILEAYVERDLSARDIVAQGFDAAIVRRVIRLVDLAEYKRRQAPPGPRITPRNFGKDRRYPITSKYRPEGDLP
jgi:NAD+ synthase (glutamine-hydrolysing)